MRLQKRSEAWLWNEGVGIKGEAVVAVGRVVFEIVFVFFSQSGRCCAASVTHVLLSLQLERALGRERPLPGGHERYF